MYQRSLKLLFGFIAALALAGCASGPAYQEVAGSFPQLAPDQGRIYIYRATSMGAAVQPDVKVNDEVVGSAVPNGFFYIDRPAGDYRISTSTEVKKTLTMQLEPGQVRYVRLNIAMGLMVGHVYPELVDSSEGQAELEKTKFTGAP